MMQFLSNARAAHGDGILSLSKLRYGLTWKVNRSSYGDDDLAENTPAMWPAYRYLLHDGIQRRKAVQFSEV